MRNLSQDTWDSIWAHANGFRVGLGLKMVPSDCKIAAKDQKEYERGVKGGMESLARHPKCEKCGK